MTLLRFLENIVRRLKHDSQYRFETTYHLRQLVTLSFYRALQLLRGAWQRLCLESVAGNLFCGRHVLIEHGYQCRFGGNVILEDGVKINALSDQGIVFGSNVTVGKDAILICTGVVRRKGVGITIGANSAIGAQSFLGGQGGITIGENVIMGPGVKIFSENHRFDDLKTPIRLQGEVRQGVAIADDCWIGAASVILDGVSIGKGVVVAAGAIVTRSVDAYSVIGGVPARVLRVRIAQNDRGA